MEWIGWSGLEVGLEEWIGGVEWIGLGFGFGVD
jgi:hypothetical protein